MTGKSMIQVPDGLISNLVHDIKISPNTTYLYVRLKLLLSDYNNNTVYITLKRLRETLGWKCARKTKANLKELKDLGYINYGDIYDESGFKNGQEIEITINKINENFKQLSRQSVFKILENTQNPEKAIRLCYLYKSYTNKEYGYAWLSYSAINQIGNIRRQDIPDVNKELELNSIISIQHGLYVTDSTTEVSTQVRENNRYSLLVS